MDDRVMTASVVVVVVGLILAMFYMAARDETNPPIPIESTQTADPGSSFGSASGGNDERISGGTVAGVVAFGGSIAWMAAVGVSLTRARRRRRRAASDGLE